jgi:hypothetical protein
MTNLQMRGELKFVRGHFPVETLYVNIMNLGHLYMEDTSGGLCVNNGINTDIQKLEGLRVSPGVKHNYAVARFVNNCAENNKVREISAVDCGRALATDTSPVLNLWVGRITAHGCTEFGVKLIRGNDISLNHVFLCGGCGYGGIHASMGDNVRIRNFWIGWLSGHGVVLDGSNSILDDGHITNCRRNGVVLGGYNNKVFNAQIYENGTGVGMGGNSKIWRVATYNNRSLGVEVNGRSATIDSCWSAYNVNGSRDRTGSASVINSSIDFR